MIWTIAEATQFYEESKAGYLSALKMKEYTIKDREVKRHNLESYEKSMIRWKSILNQLQEGGRGGIPVRRVTPLNS